jgi:hypothetical protein
MIYTLCETNNLREIQRIIADGVEDQVLQFVYHSEEIFTERGHVCECVWPLVWRDLAGCRRRRRVLLLFREERASHLLRCASPNADLYGFGRRGGVRQGGEGG